MPEISEPTLFIVCGNHECRLVGAKGRMIFEEQPFRGKELEYSDRETQLRGPSGITSGSGGDRNMAEENRIREFTHKLTEHVASMVQTQGIKAIYLAAPGKILSAIRKHLKPALQKLVKVELEGLFLKEPPLELLQRFRPDIVKAVSDLHAQENFSAKNQPKRK